MPKRAWLLLLIMFTLPISAEEFNFRLASGLNLKITTPDGISLETALSNDSIDVDVELNISCNEQAEKYLREEDGGISLALSELFQQYPNTIFSSQIISSQSGVTLHTHIPQVGQACIFQGCDEITFPCYRSNHFKESHKDSYEQYKKLFEQGRSCLRCERFLKSWKGFLQHFYKFHFSHKLPDI